MIAEYVRQKEQHLAEKVAEHYHRRAPERSEKQKRIAQEGVIGAASREDALGRMAHMTQAEGRTFEAIIGENDSDQINFLDRGKRASKAVCRVLAGLSPMGTGFLVAPGLLLTNNHVIEDLAAAQDAVAEFDFEVDADDRALQPRRFALDPATLFVTSPMDQLDFTLVAVRPQGTDGTKISDYGWLPLDPRTNKILEGEPVVIIQHPGGDEKQICLFNSTLIDRLGDLLHYTTDTMPGSSGSPAFNRHWQLVALHHASTKTGQKHDGRDVVVNEGIRVSAIMQRLADKQSADQNAARALALLSDPKILGNSRPAPVVVSGGAAGSPDFEAKTVIGMRAVSHYTGRKGYNPLFIGAGALEIPLPQLPNSLKNDTVRLISQPDQFEIKYQNYSVVMCRSRRLAYFSACNIDGPSCKALGRLDRDPDHPQTAAGDFEAADKWFFDPRVDQSAQLTAPIYDKTAFDFGHITRRLDPVWGGVRQTRIANDDTFHMTNCAPQHSDLNQRTWARLEDAILGTATSAGKRFVVITGPVLDPRDPVVLEVQVPTAFWKVVAFEDPENAGQLRSMAFMQFQTALVEEIQRSLEGLDQLDRAQQWRVAVREVARLTSLDFGPLVDADDVSNGGSDPERLTMASIDRLFPAVANVRASSSAGD